MRALALLFAAAVLATPPPPRTPGFQVGNPLAKSQLDLFLDPHCPASKEFWEFARKAMGSLVEERPLWELLGVRVHFQPLPYHQSAFLALRVFKLIERKAWGKFTDFLDLMFAKIPDYTVGALTKTQDQVKAELIADAVKAVGASTPELVKVFETPEWEQEARLAFKYAAFRGVTGTPFLFVNGVLVEDTPETVEEFVKFLARFV